MSAPLYFLPGVFGAQLYPKQVLNRQLLADRGLGDVLADVEYSDLAINEISASTGPGGKPGTILSALPVESRQPPRRMGYHPQDKYVTWHALRDGDLFMSLDAMSPVTPADLLRKRPLGGRPVNLSDSQAWQVPVIRCPLGSTDLPRSIGWHNGVFGMEVRPTYRTLWDRSADIAKFFFADTTLEFERLAADAVDALALNYRLGRDEATLLGLFDTMTVQTALAETVALDKVKAFYEDLKKKDSMTSSTPGGADCSPATDPAAGICT